MNIWSHPNILSSMALESMTDNLVIGNMCAKDKTSEFSQRSNGWKVGDSVSFRTHGDFEVNSYTEGDDVIVQDIQDSSRSMEIEEHFDVSVAITSREEALDLDSFADQIIKPAAKRLAEKVDIYLGSKILEGAGLYASDALLGTAADVALARRQAIINQMGENRFCLVDDEYEAQLLGQTWFNQSQTRGNPGISTLQSGIMGHVMGMDFHSSVNFPTTAATQAGDATFTTNNGGATANPIGDLVLTVDNGASVADGLVAGDRILVAGCKRPMIVATTIAQAACGAATSIVLVDPINEIIQDDAAVTVIGSGEIQTIHGAIFDGKALGIAFPVQDMPAGALGAVVNADGVSVRIVKQYNVTKKKTTMSLDCLVGAKALNHRNICLLSDF